MKINKIVSSNANFQVSLKFIIKDKDDKILILKTPQNSSLSGFYDFPGGRIRKNEQNQPFLTTIARELREELGNKIIYKIIENPVAISRHCYTSKINNEKQYILWIFFEAQFNGGMITLSDEHESYAWVKLNKQNYKKYLVTFESQ